MQDIGTLLDDVRDGRPGSNLTAIQEAMLLIRSWQTLPSRRDRVEMVEYLLDAAALIGAVASVYE